MTFRMVKHGMVNGSKEVTVKAGSTSSDRQIDGSEQFEVKKTEVVSVVDNPDRNSHAQTNEINDRSAWTITDRSVVGYLLDGKGDEH